MAKEEDFPRSALTNGVVTLDKKRKGGFGKFEKKRRRFSDDKGTDASGDAEDVSLPPLSSINPGSLLLGSVAVVTDHGLRIHLPNNIVGFAKLADIFDPVGPEPAKHDPAPLSAFSVGSNVVCYVLDVHNDHLSLSLKPSVINKNLGVKALFTGLLLPATVVSQEDHGLIVSFNATLKNAPRGFVKYDEDGREAVKNEFRRRHPVSATTYVVIAVVIAERELIKCRWPWAHKTPLKAGMTAAFDQIKPGLLISGQVAKVHRAQLENSAKYLFGGYTIKCLGGVNALVPPLDAVESCKALAEEAEQGARVDSLGDPAAENKPVEGRVTHVDLERRRLYVSLQSHTLRWKGPLGQAHKDLKHEVIACNVVRAFSRGLLLRPADQDKRNEHNYLFCDVGDVADDTKAKPTALLTSSRYAIGSSHECRVLDFDYLARLTRVALKKSVLAEKHASATELAAPDVVKGKIVRMLNSGAIVQVSSLVQGKVPLGHLTQVPVAKLPENMQPGRNLTLRVLKFDHPRNRLVFTAKHVLVADENPLTRFEQLHVGKQLLGYVINTRDRNAGAEPQRDRVVLKFYNDLQTYLDHDEVERARECAVDLRTDAVVKCAVTRVDRKRRTFYVTIDTSKMVELAAEAKTRKESQREKRKLACKEAFTHYKSKRKLKNKAE